MYKLNVRVALWRVLYNFFLDLDKAKISNVECQKFNKNYSMLRLYNRFTESKLMKLLWRVAKPLHAKTCLNTLIFQYIVKVFHVPAMKCVKGFIITRLYK